MAYPFGLESRDNARPAGMAELADARDSNSRGLSP